MASKFINVNCESCGADLAIPQGEASMKCGFCGTLNIGSGEGKNVFKIAQEIVKLSNKDIKIGVSKTNTPNKMVANIEDLKNILLI